MKAILISVLAVCLNLIVSAQSGKAIEALIPMNDMNQSLRKVHLAVGNLGSMVHLDITSDLNKYTSCINDSQPGGIFNAEIMSYNANDEAGKMMLQMLTEMEGIQQIMESFKNSSGMDVSNATEEDFMGGKLWLIPTQQACNNEITGPTGVTMYKTKARYFLFNGTTTFQIDITCECKPGKIKEIIGYVVEAGKNFDFASLQSGGE